MECPICWDSLLSVSTPTASIPCGHLFHEKCLETFIRQRLATADGEHPDCPTCRAPIKLIAAHGLNRIPRDLRDYVHAALRRVYLTPPDAGGQDAAKEMDYLYSRLGHLQASVQKSKQKEYSAEKRLGAIMELWKKEQAKNAQLQQALNDSRSELAAAATKMGPSAAAPRPVEQTAPPHVPSAADQESWARIEHEILSHATSQSSYSWNVLPAPSPVPSQWQLQPAQAPVITYDQSMHPSSSTVNWLPAPLQNVPLTPASMPLVPIPIPTSSLSLPSSVIPHQSPPPRAPQMPTYSPAPNNQPIAGPSRVAPSPQMVPLLPMRMSSNAALTQMRVADPRPRHLSGSPRERELANIRFMQEHARIQQRMVFPPPRNSSYHREAQTQQQQQQQQHRQGSSSGDFQGWAGHEL